MNAKRSAPSLEVVFGPLEIRVLEALWARRRGACVRDLQPDFPGVAYTTLMTTLDRLFRKGVLIRSKNGRAFYYAPKASHDQMMSELASATLANILPRSAAAVRPILSMFVDTVGQRDGALLDELEALVRARRDEMKELKGRKR
jgi:predicted transcriptional regulator